MRSIPSHLNNRYDFEYIRDNFAPEEWRPHWEKLLCDRFVWKDEKTLEPTETGLSDAAHRVVDITESADPGAPPLRMQQVLVENRHARLLRLGFTAAEVEQALAVGAYPDHD